MQFIKTAAFATIATVLSAGTAFAQDASTQLDMTQFQGGERVRMGIVESEKSFAAGMDINGDYGSAMSVRATTFQTLKENLEIEETSEGSVVTGSEIVNSTNSTAEVSFGQIVDSTVDEDGSEVEIEGSSTSVDL